MFDPRQLPQEDAWYPIPDYEAISSAPPGSTWRNYAHLNSRKTFSEKIRARAAIIEQQLGSQQPECTLCKNGGGYSEDLGGPKHWARLVAFLGENVVEPERFWNQWRVDGGWLRFNELDGTIQMMKCQSGRQLQPGPHPAGHPSMPQPHPGHPSMPQPHPAGHPSMPQPHPAGHPSMPQPHPAGHPSMPQPHPAGHPSMPQPHPAGQPSMPQQGPHPAGHQSGPHNQNDSWANYTGLDNDVQLDLELKHLPCEGKWFQTLGPVSLPTFSGGDWTAYRHLQSRKEFKALMTPRAILIDDFVFAKAGKWATCGICTAARGYREHLGAGGHYNILSKDWVNCGVAVESVRERLYNTWQIPGGWVRINEMDGAIDLAKGTAQPSQLQAQLLQKPAPQPSPPWPPSAMPQGPTQTPEPPQGMPQSFHPNQPSQPPEPVHSSFSASHSSAQSGRPSFNHSESNAAGSTFAGPSRSGGGPPGWGPVPGPGMDGYSEFSFRGQREEVNVRVHTGTGEPREADHSDGQRPSQPQGMPQSFHPSQPPEPVHSSFSASHSSAPSGGPSFNHGPSRPARARWGPVPEGREIDEYSEYSFSGHREVSVFGAVKSGRGASEEAENSDGERSSQFSFGPERIDHKKIVEVCWKKLWNEKRSVLDNADAVQTKLGQTFGNRSVSCKICRETVQIAGMADHLASIGHFERLMQAVGKDRPQDWQQQFPLPSGDELLLDYLELTVSSRSDV